MSLTISQKSYEEGNLNPSRDRNISFDERKKGEKDLLTDENDENLKWLSDLLPMYNNTENFDYLKNSGRIFNGSQEVFKKVENVKCLTNLFYPKATSYIYIISKQMGDDLYYKIGVGGTGFKDNNTDKDITSTGRLGSAQTFLIIGLGEEASFKVHYLFFFKHREQNTIEKDGSYVIEQLLHKFLQNDIFRAASILFPTNIRSEWYLIPKGQEKLFLGIVFDLMSYCVKARISYQPCEIWKLLPSHEKITSLDESYQVIQLPTKFLDRIKHIQPEYLQNLISVNDEKIIITLKPREMDVEDSIVEFKLKDLSLMVKSYKVNFTNIVRKLDSREQEYVKCKTENTGRVTRSTAQPTFETAFETFTKKEIDREIKINKDDTVNEFLIPLIVVLELLSKGNFLYDKDLRKKLYFLQKREKDSITIQEQRNLRFDIKRIPPWYLNLENQKMYAGMFLDSTKYKQYEFHVDVDVTENDGVKYTWKVINYTTDNNQVMLSRKVINEHDGSNSDRIQIVHAWRVMLIFDVMSKKITKEEEITGKHKVRRNTFIEKNTILTIRSDYFLYLDSELNPIDMDEVPIIEEKYRVKKIYRKKNIPMNLSHVFMDIVHIDEKGETRKTKEDTYYIDIEDLFNRENAAQKVVKIENPLSHENPDEFDNTYLIQLYNEKERKTKGKTTFYLPNDILRFDIVKLNKKCKDYGVPILAVPETRESLSYSYLKVISVQKSKYYTLEFLEPWNQESSWDKKIQSKAISHTIILGSSIVHDPNIFQKVHNPESNASLLNYRKKLLLDIRRIVDTLPTLSNIDFTFINKNGEKIVINNHKNFELYCKEHDKKRKLDVMYKVERYSSNDSKLVVGDMLYNGDLKIIIDEFWKNGRTSSREKKKDSGQIEYLIAGKSKATKKKVKINTTKIKLNSTKESSSGNKKTRKKL